MVDLTTTYMGLELRNPIVVGSGNLTKSVESIVQCAASGAGAVVMKSLFEIPGEPDDSGETAPVEKLLRAEQYLDTIRQAKMEVSIPLIASICCASMETWKAYAELVCNAGADAIELNISVAPSLTIGYSKAIEDLYVIVLEEIRKTVNIPLSVKLSPYLTSLMRLAYNLAGSGASALVLFNRFFQIDVDIDNLRLTAGSPLSSEQETSNVLRWMALLYGKLECDLAASTGVYGAEQVVKHLLAGAKVVQLYSTLSSNGLAKIDSILGFLESWMERQGFESVGQFRGMLSQEECRDSSSLEKLQYT